MAVVRARSGHGYLFFGTNVANLLTVNNHPTVDGYFDTTLDIVLPSVFQAPLSLASS